MLITCCPRGGSHYVTQILREYGFDFLHESDGEDGMTNWFLTPELPDDSKIIQRKNSKIIIEPNGCRHVLKRPLHRTFPLPTKSFKSEYNNIHQVRHPLHCIISMSKVFPRNKSWALSFVPNIEEEQALTGKSSWILECMKMWYYWNSHGEKNARWTYRVEGLTERPVFDEFCEYLEIEDEDRLWGIVNKTKTNVCQRKNLPKITWDNIKSENEGLYDKICVLANHYGYER
jgi:hypothetical protein